MPQRPHLPVPYHSIGISQIVAYGLLFYVFAQLKTPLAEAIGTTESSILAAISGSLVLQGLLAPVIGGWVDRFGALPVMTLGLVIGALGMFMLPLIPALEWVWFCMVPIGLAFAMSTYEVAFSAAVQLDEVRARRNISYITFYGGVASSITWLSIAPLLTMLGLKATCSVIAVVMLIMAARFFLLSRRIRIRGSGEKEAMAPFSWSGMTREEKQAIILLALTSTLEYLVFASTTLLWINWFSIQFGAGLAVVLASIYGPFQVVGRIMEMWYGQRFDARLTALVAFTFVPTAIVLAQSPSLPVVVVAMMLFGIGHGVLTVSFGYVTNMYFRAEVYGRAKGWISTPRGLGNAIGPSIGGALFLLGTDIFFAVMVAVSIAGGITFAFLLRLKPGNLIPAEQR